MTISSFRKHLIPSLAMASAAFFAAPPVREQRI